MRRIVFLSTIAVASLLFLPGCEKENGETKDSKVETLSAEKGSLCIATLTGRVSGLEGVALDFECGIEYSTDASFAEDKTTRQKADKKYSEDPYTVTITNVTSGQKYYYRAYYISQLMIYYGSVKDFTFTWEVAQNGTENGHQYIELGLSVRWATYNVGASKPEEYGDYYAWGETEPKANYSLSTYKYSNGSYSTLTKYCYNSSNGYNGFTDTLTTLLPEDDVAHVKWGGDWRMPTKDEFTELLNNCTWTWTTLNGVNGYRVTSKKSGYTDRSIFLPTAGYRHVTSLYNVGSRGDYWSSSLGTDYPNDAWFVYFNSDDHNTSYRSRFGGLSVRPVCP